jgi:hypothetical protein
LPSTTKTVGASHLTSTHNSLSYFIDLLQLEVHPLNHATTSHLVAYFLIQTPKNEKKIIFKIKHHGSSSNPKTPKAK